MEEAILLLMILLRKFNLKRIERDPSVMHHLTFALAMSGQLIPLAVQFEELLPGVLNNKRECLYNVALCDLAQEDDLNLLKQILKAGEDSDHLKELSLASKACVETSAHTEGASYARRAIANMQGGCEQVVGVADVLFGT
jgi:ATP-dependent RNA helicase DHX36